MAEVSADLRALAAELDQLMHEQALERAEQAEAALRAAQENCKALKDSEQAWKRKCDDAAIVIVRFDKDLQAAQERVTGQSKIISAQAASNVLARQHLMALRAAVEAFLARWPNVQWGGDVPVHLISKEIDAMEMANSLCGDWDCPGYSQPPDPGDLWPGETREQFGYPKAEGGSR